MRTSLKGQTFSKPGTTFYKNTDGKGKLVHFIKVRLKRKLLVHFQYQRVLATNKDLTVP